MYLTQSEMEIMQSFWQSEEPMSLGELIEASPNRSWRDRSGFSIINSLIKKGLLREEGFVHSGKTIARTFTPIVGATDFMINQIDAYEGKIELSQLVAHLLGNESVKEKDIKELDKLLNDKKKELKSK